MHEFSFWEKDAFFEGIDYAVIGGGITGITAAIVLKEKRPRARVVVFERGTLPAGASTRNAGFACFGSLSELTADTERTSFDETLELVKMRYAGLRRLRERCGDDALHYEAFGGTELFGPTEEDRFQQCQEILPIWNDALRSITDRPDTFQIIDRLLPAYRFGNTRHLIYNTAEGQLHPGKMMRNLNERARQLGVTVLSGFPIVDFGEDARGAWLHLTNDEQLRVGMVVCAVNAFAKCFLPDLDVQPARNQVWLTEPLSDLHWDGAFHSNEGYWYFRNVGERILLGGGRHLDPDGENTDLFGSSNVIEKGLERLLHETIFPGKRVKIEHRWSGIMGVGDTKKPIVRKVENHLAVAVRLGGMGVAIGSLVGEQVADLVISG